MNKLGKGNSVFIVLMPIFVLISFVVIDTVIKYSEENNYKKMTESIIQEVVDSNIGYDYYFDEIKRLYEFNGYETDMLVVDANDYNIYIENEHKYIGLFSSVFGTGEEEFVKLFGLIDFKLKKGSRTIVKVNVTFDENNILEYDYVE